jgi:hypothetical protein
VTPQIGDTTYSMTWVEVRTTEISFLIPSDWKTPSVTINANGIGTLSSIQFRVDSPDGTTLVIVNLKTGETLAIVDGQQLSLRHEGPDGAPVDLSTLVSTAGPSTPALYRLVESITLATAATPVATPSATATPPASPPTATPTTTP